MLPPPALFELNFLPLRYINDSWLDHFPQGQLIRELRHYPQVERQLSDYILQQLNLSGHYVFAIEAGIGASLALASQEQIVNLVKYSGAYLCHQRIRVCVDGQQVRQIRQAIGEEAYLFALKRAPYLSHLALPTIKQTHQLAKQSIISGIYCLQAALAELAPALRDRVLLKIPYQWGQQLRKIKQHAAGSQLAELAAGLYDELTT